MNYFKATKRLVIRLYPELRVPNGIMWKKLLHTKLQARLLCPANIIYQARRLQTERPI